MIKDRLNDYDTNDFSYFRKWFLLSSKFSKENKFSLFRFIDTHTAYLKYKKKKYIRFHSWVRSYISLTDECSRHISFKSPRQNGPAVELSLSSLAFGCNCLLADSSNLYIIPREVSRQADETQPDAVRYDFYECASRSARVNSFATLWRPRADEKYVSSRIPKTCP